jgi:hypothetical protein
MTSPEPTPEPGPRYQGLRLDGPLREFHRAVDRLRWDTIPGRLHEQPPADTPPQQRRHQPPDGQRCLLDPKE